MARAVLEAQRDGTIWTLLFENGLRDRLRVGGFFAGHDTKEDLKKELRRQFWEQEQREDGENLGHYLRPQTCALPSPLPSASSMTNTSVLKDVKTGRRRKLSRGVASLDAGQGDQHALVFYSTRAAVRKSKLEASKKRRIYSAKTKQKLANDEELYALGTRRVVLGVVTRSSSNL